MMTVNGSSPLPGLCDEDQIMEWNRDLPDPELSSVHKLIAHNSCTQPNAPAICAWDGRFSYLEIDAHATLLAHRLMELGAQKEQFVPLCFEKSAFAVISLLGVLKAGAACVFLDPTHPIDRLHTMLEDLRAKILLCSPGVRPQFDMQKFGNLSLLEVTTVFFETSRAPNVRLPISQPGDAAIGLFTSGSTGKPKGIIQNHSTAAFSAQTCSRVFGITTGSRVLQWAAYCFDMSVIDILMTLVGGGCLCIPSEKDRTDNLIKFMRDMKINFAAMTPSFAQTIKSEGLESLQTLVFGGEPVSKDHLTGWPNNIRIINGYGPAEGSVCVAGVVDRECPANVGKAVGSVTWIADENDPARLVSIGAIGELLIEGPLLARGYLNDPEKTAASFIENLPWLTRVRGVPKALRRVYKTGDLARYGENGSIILMGRKDTQIKLRGQRIEAAEVEHNISSLLPAGFTVIVDVIRPVMRPESQTLVAFIGEGAKTQSSFDEELILVDKMFEQKLALHLNGIEGRLKRSLPTYMAPSCFIPFKYIPLTSSGKVDRKRLKHIGSNLPSEKIRSFPSEPVYNAKGLNGVSEYITLDDIAELWQSTIGLEKPPTDPSSNFFGQGGDSIMAMKLVTMARNAGIDLNTKQVFENRTLAAMASVARPLSSLPENISSQEQYPLKPSYAPPSLLKDIFSPNHTLVGSEIEEIIDAPDMQAYMVVCGLLGSHGYITYFAFDLEGEIDSDRLELACKSVVERHSALRTVFGIRAGQVLQIVLKSYPVEFQRHRSPSSTGDLLSNICKNEQICCSRFGDSIVRFLLVERESAKHTLIMRISHAQFDGTSLGLIYNDLQKTYEGQKLDPVPQFIDFSRIVRKENDDAAEGYWRKLLQGSSMTSIVNHSKPCYANAINNKIYLTFPFTGVGRSDITLATVVKAAWALILAEMASTRDVVFGYAVTGREIPLKGVEKIVGDCNNAALARIVIKEGENVVDLLNRIQEQYIDTIPYQSIGLRQMVEKCTDWPRWTRYSTSVNHQNYADAGVDTFQISNAVCKVSYRDFEVDRRDVQVYSWPPKDGQMKIAMAFCDRLIPGELAQKMLEALGKRIQALVFDVNVCVAIPSDPVCRIPLEAPTVSDHIAGDSLPQPHRFGFSMLDPAAIVSRVWKRFISSCTKNLLERFDVTDHTAFYTFAGDLVYAAQMSAFYEEEGIGFSMELLIENATQRSQRKVLELVLKCTKHIFDYRKQERIKSAAQRQRLERNFFGVGSPKPRHPLQSGAKRKSMIAQHNSFM